MIQDFSYCIILLSCLKYSSLIFEDLVMIAILQGVCKNTHLKHKLFIQVFVETSLFLVNINTYIKTNKFFTSLQTHIAEMHTNNKDCLINMVFQFLTSFLHLKKTNLQKFFLCSGYKCIVRYLYLSLPVSSHTCPHTCGARRD